MTFNLIIRIYYETRKIYSLKKIRKDSIRSLDELNIGSLGVAIVFFLMLSTTKALALITCSQSVSGAHIMNKSFIESSVNRPLSLLNYLQARSLRIPKSAEEQWNNILVISNAMGNQVSAPYSEHISKVFTKLGQAGLDPSWEINEHQMRNFSYYRNGQQSILELSDLLAAMNQYPNSRVPSIPQIYTNALIQELAQVISQHRPLNSSGFSDSHQHIHNALVLEGVDLEAIFGQGIHKRKHFTTPLMNLSTGSGSSLQSTESSVDWTSNISRGTDLMGGFIDSARAMIPS